MGNGHTETALWVRGDSTEDLTAEEAKILPLFDAGMGYPEIIEVVWGKVAGPRFKAKREIVEQVIRRARGA